MATQQGMQIPLRVVPTLTHQFLPRCGACGEKHPLAFTPPKPAEICPGCGGPSGAPGRVVTETAEFSGLSGWIANLLMDIGAALMKLAKGI